MAATKPPRGRARGRPTATVLQRAIRMLARRDMSRAELAARLASPRGAGAADARVPIEDDAADSGMGISGTEISVVTGVSVVSGASVGADAPSSEPPVPTAEAVDAALNRLAAIGLQSDQRFAENYVRGRQARTGSRRLAAELRQRGVDRDTIGTALETLVTSDLERARALWARRFESARDPRERARQMRFLAARGFDMAVIRAVLGGTDADDEPTDPD